LLADFAALHIRPDEDVEKTETGANKILGEN
jgi:hypothetical protein